MDPYNDSTRTSTTVFCVRSMRLSTPEFIVSVVAAAHSIISVCMRPETEVKVEYRRVKKNQSCSFV